MSSSPVPEVALTNQLKTWARTAGFDFCRTIPVGTPPHAEYFKMWLAAGNAASMNYLHRNADKRCHPNLLREGGEPFRSMIVLAVDYRQSSPSPADQADPSKGLIASYAWGDDYHEVIRPLLNELDSMIRAKSGRSTRGKCLVDSGPVLERDWAEASGIGFFGKNCCIINPEHGSWLFVATMLIPEILQYDQLHSSNSSCSTREILSGVPRDTHFGFFEILPEDNQKSRLGSCGRCTRCMAACPTDAFHGPFSLNSGKCISYWTIETRDPIPMNLRSSFGNRIFGCDVCQDVCPWNKSEQPGNLRMSGLAQVRGRSVVPLLSGFDPSNPFWLDQAAFAHEFKNSAIKRAKRAGMLRNVCVALGNWGAREAIAPLQIAISDPEPVVRGHAAWALGRVRILQARREISDFLRNRRRVEPDDYVRSEIDQALIQL